MGTVTDTLNIARAQIGVTEQPPNSNRTKYGEWYRFNGVFWCAIFLSWVIAHGGGRSYRFASVAASLAWARQNGRHTLDFQPGYVACKLYTSTAGHTGIVEAVHSNGEVTTIEGNCLPVETPVLTPSGWVPIGDLRPGAEVIDPKGQPSRVVAVHHRGRQQVYEVDTGCGSVEATADHLWAVEVVSSRHRHRVVTTSDLASSVAAGGKVRLPDLLPPDLDGGGMRTLDPWLLGFLLGDGCLGQKDGLSFTSIDTQLIGQVKDALPVGHSITPSDDLGSYRISGQRPVNFVRAEIRALGVNVGSHAKFVPSAYLWAPVKDRLRILQGLLDSDGHVDKEGRIEFSSVSSQLALDVQFLVRSLGGKCRINYKADVWYTSPTQATRKSASPCYRVQNIRFADQTTVPFTLARKVDRLRERRWLRGWNVQSVTPTRVTEVACIEVSAPSRLFVTKDFIPTHNTGGSDRDGGAVMRRRRSRTFWNKGCIRIDYDGAEAPPVTPPPAKPPAGRCGEPHPGLRSGSRGQAIVHLQNLLRSTGSKIAADGDFGPATRDAVINFQRWAQIGADGVCGPVTWGQLHHYITGQSI